MSEHIEETLSALMDNEASELDVHRLLKEAGQSDAVAQRSRRYQLARSAMHDDNVDLLAIDLSARVSAALDSEPVPAAGPGWLKPLGGLAVAASVAAVVVLGSRSLLPGSSTDVDQPASFVASSAIAPILGQETTRQAAVSSRQGAIQRDIAGAQQAARQALLQRQVDAYMRIHAQHASMNGSQGALPLARAADFRLQ